jgi:ribA/ribD-fused uncharacterized protein
MRQTDKFVFFYGNADHLSNFYKTTFVYSGKTFSCGEQFIMYGKAKVFKDEEIAHKILLESSPTKIKALGRKVKNFDDGVWRNVREDIAYIGLREKYRQNDGLKNALICTGERTIVEASPRDKIWGIGMGENNPSVEDTTKWKGTNILGKILMRVRKQIVLENTVLSVMA